ESKTSFEQIPIETVKRIAKEFPEKDAVGSDSENAETRDEARSSSERWREMAQRVQQEQNPRRVIELVEQLIVALDQERLCNRLPHTRDAGNGQVATEPGGSR